MRTPLWQIVVGKVAAVVRRRTVPRPAGFVCRALVTLALLVPQASWAQKSKTEHKGRESVAVDPCADWPGDDVLLWSTFGHAHGAAPISNALPGWVDVQILEDAHAQQEMKLSPLLRPESEYSWIALRPAGGGTRLPLLLPTALARELRGSDPVWADVRDDFSRDIAVFFRPGGRPIGAIISTELGSCWDQKKRAVPYRDLLDPLSRSLTNMAEANDFDAAKAMRASGIEGMKRLRLKIVPPPYSRVRGQGTLVATSNRKDIAARVGECLAVRGRNAAKVALFRYFCEREATVVRPPEPFVHECGDDFVERVVYMILFESRPE